MNSSSLPNCFITLDIGTTSIKTALFDQHGNMLTSANKEYTLHTPAEDIVELDPEVYWQCCKEGIRDILCTSQVLPRCIRSIGCCSQGETLIVLDKEGKALRNAIVWIDNRSKKEAEEISQAFGSENPTGQTGVFPTWPVTKILWLKRNQPEVYQKAYKYLLVEDYILYRLTRKFIGEFTLYNSSYMLDIRCKAWWKSILDYVGIGDEQLVELYEPGKVVTSLDPEVSKALGLEPDTKVVTGAMDQTAVLVGAGNIRAGMVTETTGSALVICETLEQLPEVYPEMMAVQHHAVPGKYFLIGWCASGGMTFKWLRDTFFAAERDQAIRENKDPYDLLIEMAEEVPPGAQGLLFFPYMSGPGTLPIDPNVRGVFYGLELHHTRAHFVRSLLESLAFVIRENIEEMAKLGSRCTEIRSLGGGSKSRLWNQIKADVTGKSVTTMTCTEAASLGTAILQAHAIGIYPSIEAALQEMVQPAEVKDPGEENHKRYEEVYQRYLRLERKYFGSE